MLFRGSSPTMSIYSILVRIRRSAPTAHANAAEVVGEKAAKVIIAWHVFVFDRARSDNALVRRLSGIFHISLFCGCSISRACGHCKYLYRASSIETLSQHIWQCRRKWEDTWSRQVQKLKVASRSQAIWYVTVFGRLPIDDDCFWAAQSQYHLSLQLIYRSFFGSIGLRVLFN